VLACNGVGTTVTITVSDEKTKVTVNGGKYELNAKRTAATFTSPADRNAKKLEIADTVKIGGKEYKVTKIAAGACRGMAKLKTLVIGKNVKSIGAKAFYECEFLKKITFRTALLTGDTVGAKAFGKIAEKPEIKCPAKVKKEYK
ncbi:leucine-rich repeat protein, partial [Vibrio sp. FNV 38]|nr:leucine-rich repeat protein [Vibrio sp. FNV 38]